VHDDRVEAGANGLTIIKKPSTIAGWHEPVMHPSLAFGIRHATRGETMMEHTTGGQLSLAQLAAQHHTQPSTILRLTAQHSPGGAYPGNVSEYINGVFTGGIAHDQHMPAGLRLYLPS
jgi:hypothetical protein